MKKIKFILTILLATIVAGSAFAQNRTVSGTVKDSNGEPVVGAAVIVPKSTIGASTDIDGKFALSVPEKTLSLEVNMSATLQLRLPGGQLQAMRSCSGTIPIISMK